jgi:hypothetical protein
MAWLCWALARWGVDYGGGGGGGSSTPPPFQDKICMEPSPPPLRGDPTIGVLWVCGFRSLALLPPETPKEASLERQGLSDP